MTQVTPSDPVQSLTNGVAQQSKLSRPAVISITRLIPKTTNPKIRYTRKWNKIKNKIKNKEQ
jgi:hypothetical protein